MDFSLNEFQREIADLSNKVLADYCNQDRLRDAESKDYFDPELWQQMAEAGMLGLALPEAVGGMGQDFETLMILLEQLGRHVAPLPGVAVLATASQSLLPYLDVAGVQEALSTLSSGKGLLSCALAETGLQGGNKVETRAEGSGSQVVLHGGKSRVPGGMQASHCWTLARHGDALGIYIFACAQEGVQRRPQQTTSGEALAQFTLAGARAELVATGEAVNGILTTARHAQRAASAAYATGLCEGMITLASAHCSERKQFGKPLGSFQAVAHQLADCYIDKECLRAASEAAACQLRDGGDASEACLVAAYWATEALHRISHRCQQVHGGTGVDRDYPLYRYSLQARQVEMDLGGQSRILAELGKDIAGQKVA
ncbi:acyl-CoA/acyl-ACP dehydrogenase [Spongiibacter nanhainus]|uniref:Acyl-CoA/acyl-ACP dehydrogenase n=1 Tax=Spongiibacter nanhainus TaxID=2794344 RepID=A0A7T4UP79_9GAMM|nr:acyl-CoA dehydrogenase family protein [Spongiibacter nanhainus]QQD17346.1 acyl-CoA/acyl-ACP dehydrogenase [Spongiibacter nanhainus]